MRIGRAIGIIGLIASGLVVLALGVKKETLQAQQVDFRVPDVELVDQNDRRVRLIDYLADERPVMVTFAFTSCTTVCSQQALLFGNFQKRLEKTEAVKLVSITVDPEVDTPQVLHAYLDHFHARPGWDFLTGDKRDIQRVMQAFHFHLTDMYRTNVPLLLRSARDGQWTRVDGVLNGQSLMQEYQRLLL